MLNIKKIVFGLLIFSSFAGGLWAVPSAQAQGGLPCPPGAPGANCRAQQQSTADPDGIETDIGNGCIDQDPDTCLENNELLNDIQMGVNFLAAGVGLVVVVMIMIGGISYITAGENAQAVVAAKAKIRNAIFALIVFALIWSFFEWMIPGGIFR